jgi:hypothetical protein
MIYTINAFICIISIENENLKLPQILSRYFDITFDSYAILLSLPFNNVEGACGLPFNMLLWWSNKIIGQVQILHMPMINNL